MHTVHELITALQKLPPERMILVDVQDIGFLEIIGIYDEPSDPGALIMLEGANSSIDQVRRINSLPESQNAL